MNQYHTPYGYFCCDHFSLFFFVSFRRQAHLILWRLYAYGTYKQY